MSELEAFLKPFSGLFRRKQTAQNVERYVIRLLTDLQRNL